MKNIFLSTLGFKTTSPCSIWGGLLISICTFFRSDLWLSSFLTSSVVAFSTLFLTLIAIFFFYFLEINKKEIPNNLKWSTNYTIVVLLLNSLASIFLFLLKLTIWQLMREIVGQSSYILRRSQKFGALFHFLLHIVYTFLFFQKIYRIWIFWFLKIAAGNPTTPKSNRQHPDFASISYSQ